MQRLFFAVILMVFSFQAHAADISAQFFNTSGMDTFYWEQVNNDDTTAEVLIKRPGLWHFFVDGTAATVDLKLQYGKTSGSLKDIDTDQMPDGVRFSSASTANGSTVCLGPGYVDISFTSAGSATQDVDIWLQYLGDC